MIKMSSSHGLTYALIGFGFQKEIAEKFDDILSAGKWINLKGGSGCRLRVTSKMMKKIEQEAKKHGKETEELIKKLF